MLSWLRSRSQSAHKPMFENLESRQLMSVTYTMTPVPTASFVSATPISAKLTVSPSATSYALIGGNLQEQAPYGLDHGLANLVKSGTIQNTGGGTTYSKDANGWPTQDFQVQLWGASTVDSGVYNVSFTGPAGTVVTRISGGNVILTKTGYNAATGLHTYTMNVISGATSLALRFTNTGGNVKNVQVLQPGSTPGNPWSPKYIKLLKNLAPDSLRMKDIILTDKGNTTSNWSDRPKPTDATYARAGVSWEDLVSLCNQVGSNMWACIPVNATNDYVTQLANLFKNNLNANLKVYVEYSSEVWNFAYPQGKQNLNNAVAEVNRGGSNLKYDGSSSQYVWADRLYARRSMDISNIFKNVFGAGSINSRVRVVVANQVAVLGRFDTMLNFIKAKYGAPSQFFYGAGFAPYFTMNLYNDDLILANHVPGGTSLTKDQILDGMSRSVSAYETQRRFATYVAKSAQFGLKAELYEAGGDTHGSYNILAKQAASLDPKIIGIIQRYVNAWKNQGGDVMMWYTYGARPFNGPFGTWTIVNSRDGLNQAKAQAIRSLRGLPLIV